MPEARQEVEQVRTDQSNACPYMFFAAEAQVLKASEGGHTVKVHALIASALNAEANGKYSVCRSPAEDGAGLVGAVPRPGRTRPVKGSRWSPPTLTAGSPRPSARRPRPSILTRKRLTDVNHPSQAWGWVEALLHAIYDQSGAEAVYGQVDRNIDASPKKLPDVTAHRRRPRRYPRLLQGDLASDLVSQCPRMA
jgi:putative transposase